MNEQKINKKKYNKNYIGKTFHRYTSLYADLMSKYSNLTDKQRIIAINQFEIGYKILEYYYFNREDVLEKDLLFGAVEKILEELEEVHAKYTPKKKSQIKK